MEGLCWRVLSVVRNRALDTRNGQHSLALRFDSATLQLPPGFGLPRSVETELVYYKLVRGWKQDASARMRCISWLIFQSSRLFTLMGRLVMGVSPRVRGNLVEPGGPADAGLSPRVRGRLTAEVYGCCNKGELDGKVYDFLDRKVHKKTPLLKTCAEGLEIGSGRPV